MNISNTANDEIVNWLNEFAEIASITGSVVREKAYRAAINGIKSIDYNIADNIDRLSTRELKIPGVGTGILRKIVEWVKTGRITELIKLKNSKEICAYKEFSKIFGVGPVTIGEWIGLGIYTLGDLRRAIAKEIVSLTDAQKYGLMYYGDLNEKIPRDEVTQLGNYVSSVIRRIDVHSVITICGSYRRGSESSSDIDMLISNPTINIANPLILREIKATLEGDPNYIAALSIGKERYTFLYRSAVADLDDKKADKKSARPTKVRQIDILNLAYVQYYPGILYFTGSWEFNEKMRGFAKMRGFRLNQKGLFKITTIKSRSKVPKTIETLIVTNSEEEIFATLGLQYVAPSMRTIAAVIPIAT